MSPSPLAKLDTNYPKPIPRTNCSFSKKENPFHPISKRDIEEVYIFYFLVFEGTYLEDGMAGVLLSTGAGRGIPPGRKDFLNKITTFRGKYFH